MSEQFTHNSGDPSIDKEELISKDSPTSSSAGVEEKGIYLLSGSGRLSSNRFTEESELLEAGLFFLTLCSIFTTLLEVI